MYFGTKTRYEEVNPHLLRDAFSVNRSILRAPTSERCSPVHLTALIRHGSRYPTVKNIRRIRKLSELVRREASGGSEYWLQDIQSRWENWFTDDMDGESLPTVGGSQCSYTAKKKYFRTISGQLDQCLFVFMIVLEYYMQIYSRLLPTCVQKDQYFSLTYLKKTTYFN